MSHETPGPRPAQMDDELPMARLLRVAAVAIAVGLFGVGWAYGQWKLTVRIDQPHGPPPLPARIGAAEQGVVFQHPFDQLRDGLDLRESERRRLGSYGWVDRARGVVHVPIDVAIDQLLGDRP